MCMVVKASGSRPPRPRKAEPLHQALVDAIPLPAAALDRHGRVQALNAAWEDAATPGGVIATTDCIGDDHIRQLRDEKGFAREAGRAVAACLQRTLESGEPASCEYQLGDPPATWRASMRRVPVEDEPILLVHQDITADDQGDSLRSRLDELSVAREHSQAVSADRQRLLATAEQSFHAPLTPIRLQLHLLRQGMLGDLDARQAAALERIERNVQRWNHLQERLVSDLMALEQKEQPREPADIGELFDEAMGVFHERALKLGIRLRVDRSDHPMPVHVERRPIVQVMMLLMDHAVRETPSGGLVWVRLRPGNGHAELVIQDQDPMIEPEDVEAIWGEGEDTALRGAMRHGQAVIERQGGTLQLVCDGPGRGLESIVQLPLASSGSDGASATEEAAHRA